MTVSGSKEPGKGIKEETVGSDQLRRKDNGNGYLVVIQSFNGQLFTKKGQRRYHEIPPQKLTLTNVGSDKIYYVNQYKI